MIKKSVISLISYDWEYLPKSIESYYDYVDEIVLGLDKNKVSWSGNKFEINENKLFPALQAVDKDKKINIIESDFCKSKIAIENDNYERNYLKNLCTHDWIFSFDADEVLLNAHEFFYKFLPVVDRYYKDYDLMMTWATPFKEIDDKTLIIADADGTPFLTETQGVITHKNNTFTYARWTENSKIPGKPISTPLIALHYSLCRPKDELHQKINNIGHSDLAKKDPFFDLWNQVNLDNYTQARDFKTSGMGPQWPRLVAVPTEGLKDIYLAHQHKVYR